MTGSLTLALVAMAAAALMVSPNDVEAARLVIRLTARTSLVLFVLAFTASSLARLAPGASTRWLRRNRRYVGVAFAASHAIHGVAILALARLDPALFRELTNPATLVGGGLAYLFIILMTLTSFDRTTAAIGARAWRILHLSGAWYIWISFALNFGKRAAVNPAYWPAAAIVFVALVIRLAPMWRRKGAGEPSGA